MFQCFRCGYTSNHKCVLKTHINKQKICEPILSNLTQEQLNVMFKNNELLPDKNIISYQTKELYILKKKLLLAESENKKLSNEYENIFKENKDLKKECQSMKQKNKNLELQITINNNNNHTVINNNNNVVFNVYPPHLYEKYTPSLNIYLHENMKPMHLNLNKYFSNLEKDWDVDLKAWKRFLKDIHFNYSYPENKNIRWVSKKDGILEIYQNDKNENPTWVMYKKKDFLSKFIFARLKDIRNAFEHACKYGKNGLNKSYMDEWVKHDSYWDLSDPFGYGPHSRIPYDKHILKVTEDLCIQETIKQLQMA